MVATGATEDALECEDAGRTENTTAKKKKKQCSNGTMEKGEQDGPQKGVVNRSWKKKVKVT